MRVLMVTTSFPRHEGDHAGHFVATLAETLVTLGCQVTVLAPHEGSLPVHETMRGVLVERFRYLPPRAEQVAYGSGIVENLRRRPLAAAGLIPFAIALRRALRRLAPDHDLVHVHWAPTAALAAPWHGPAPYVITLHGSDVTLAHRGGIWLSLLRRALSRAAGANVVAEAQRRFLTGHGLWDARRPLAVIPAGIPAELLDRPRPARPDGPFRFVFAGRLVEAKGVTDLLAAFDAMRGRGVEARLDLVGSGPLQGAVDAAAGADGRIRALGQRSHTETLEIIAAADALVLPSHGEGSPLVVAEALALGTPVIGTAVGALPELLGEDGLCVRPHDPGALSAAMERLAGDRGLWERLSAEGRARASERLTWDTVARETLGFYESAHAGGGAR